MKEVEEVIAYISENNYISIGNKTFGKYPNTWYIRIHNRIMQTTMEYIRETLIKYARNI